MDGGEDESTVSVSHRQPASVGFDSDLEESSSLSSTPRNVQKKDSFVQGVQGLPFSVLQHVNLSPSSSSVSLGGITALQRGLSGGLVGRRVSVGEHHDDDESSGDVPTFTMPVTKVVVPSLGFNRTTTTTTTGGAHSDDDSSGDEPSFSGVSSGTKGLESSDGGRKFLRATRSGALTSSDDSDRPRFGGHKSPRATTVASPDENTLCLACNSALQLGKCQNCEPQQIGHVQSRGKVDQLLGNNALGQRPVGKVPSRRKLDQIFGGCATRQETVADDEADPSVRNRASRHDGGSLRNEKELMHGSFDEGALGHGNDLAKASKFFGTHISEGTAAALKKGAPSNASPVPISGAKALPLELKQTRHRRASSAEEHRYVAREDVESLSARDRSSSISKAKSSKGESRSEGAVTPAGTGVPGQSGSSASPSSIGSSFTGTSSMMQFMPDSKKTSGRLSVSFFRPSGLKAGTKFYLEMSIDSQIVCKTPALEKKKPEWFCNFAVDATLDSLLVVRLFNKTKEQTESVSVRLHTLPCGKEATLSLEFPSGERVQVFLLALNFGEVTSSGVDSASEEARVRLEPPTVLDVFLSSLYDIALPDEYLKRPYFAQVLFSDMAMRSSRLELVPERRCIQDINLDATFRVVPPFSDRLLVQIVGADGEVGLTGKINVPRLAESPASRSSARVGFFLELRDASGVYRAFGQVRLSLSQPTLGILTSLGRPLQGIPLRVDFGDVVLFNFKSLSAQLISAATQSSWDHAGIVYEEDGKLCFLEALSGGVQAVDANARFLDALNQPGGAKIGIRRFVGTRTPEMQAQLWSFAIAMTGRSYKKNIGQLVGSRWGRNKVDDLSSVFCSELVAAAFKHLDLLDESFVASNVLPKDLAGTDFQLRRGALGPIVLYTTPRKAAPQTPVTGKASLRGMQAKRPIISQGKSPPLDQAVDDQDDESSSL